MKNAVILDVNDIKAIIAKHFNVPESSIIKSQYSYIVTDGGEADAERENTNT